MLTQKTILLSLGTILLGHLPAYATPPSIRYPSAMAVRGSTAYVAWGGTESESRPGGDEPRPIWAVDLATGKLLWSLPGPHFAREHGLHVAQGRMFVRLAANPPGMSVVDLRSGKIETTIAERPSTWRPAIGNDDYYVTEYGTIIDCRTGQKVAALDHAPIHGTAICAGRLFTLTGIWHGTDGVTARIVDLATGTVDDEGFSASQLAIGGGHVVVLTPKGLLRASVETGALAEIARPK
jgi:hypothetical protein